MRRASALCFTVLMVFIGAIVLRENLSMTTPEGDVDRQTAEAGDLPAKIQDRAPGAVSVELHLAAPTALVASPLAEIPSSEPQFSQTARASLWSYNGSILQLERAGRIQRFHYGEHRQGSAGKSGEKVRLTQSHSGARERKFVDSFRTRPLRAMRVRTSSYVSMSARRKR